MVTITVPLSQPKECKLECTKRSTHSCPHAHCPYNLVGNIYKLFVTTIRPDRSRSSDIPSRIRYNFHFDVADAIVILEKNPLEKWRYNRLKRHSTVTFTHRVKVVSLQAYNLDKEFALSGSISQEYHKGILIALDLKQDSNEPYFFTQQSKEVLLKEGVRLFKRGMGNKPRK